MKRLPIFFIMCALNLCTLTPAYATKLCPGVRPMKKGELSERRKISQKIKVCRSPVTDAEICECLNKIQDELDK